MRRSLVSLVVTVPTLCAACTGGTTPPAAREPASAPPPASPASPAEPATPGATIPAPRILASGEALPAGCEAATPPRRETVAFVAEGRAWALSPHGRDPVCLFEVSEPGPFLWGPRGDRALLGRLEMLRLGGRELRAPAPADLEPGPADWGHPLGKAVVFVSPDGAALLEAYPGTDRVDDISPLPGARYLNVVYHPSGLALAFVAEQGGEQSIWLSTNTGERPVQLVFSEVGTEFGALAFSPDGQVLTYAAQHADGHPELHALDLTAPGEAPAFWVGVPGEHVLAIHEPARPGREVLGLTLGTSCDDSRAATLEGDALRPLLPAADAPTRVLGWLDGRRILVGAGGCEGPLDISSYDVATGALLPLAFGVDAASARVRAPSPAPPLPTSAEGELGGPGVA